MRKLSAWHVGRESTARGLPRQRLPRVLIVCLELTAREQALLPPVTVRPAPLEHILALRVCPRPVAAFNAWLEPTKPARVLQPALLARPVPLEHFPPLLALPRSQWIVKIARAGHFPVSLGS